MRTAVTDPRGCQTTTVYESTKTYPQTVTNCLGHFATYAYDPGLGVNISETDPNGQLTTYNYDTFGRLTAVIGPLYGEITYDYVAWGSPTQQHVQALRGGLLFSADYFDGLGRVYQKANQGPSGTTIQSEAAFDSRSLVLAATAPHFSTESPPPPTSFVYDPLGRQTRVNHPDGTFATSAYSVPGVVTLTDERGKTKQKHFDAYGRLIEVDEVNGTETYYTQYAYDAAGSLLTVTNHLGHLTKMAYDSLGRKIAMCDPNMGTAVNIASCTTASVGAWVYSYNPAGDLLTQTDAKNQTLTFTYDSIGRPTIKKQGSTTLVQWTYDTTSISPPPTGGDYPIGRLTQVYQPPIDTTTRFAYDAKGRTLQTNRQLLGVWYTMSQTYDTLSRIATETFNDGEIATYNYNGDWVQSIASSNSGNYINDIQYNARGQKTDLTYGNGLLSHFDYNQNNFRVTAHTTFNPQTLNYIQNLSYLYDNVGNITSIQDNLGGTAWRNFQYDDLNRLTYAEGAFGTNQSFTSCTYVYDPIGDPNKCSYTFSYGDAMHPSAVTYNPATSKNYSYDSDGNMMTRGSPTLTWDVDNRVTSISSQGGTTYMNYDDDGVRVEKNAPAGITLYPFAGVEIEPNNVMTKYIRIGGETFASKKGTSQYFYHNDHLGGINVITDISCTEVQRNEYDPWGSVSKAVGNIEPTHRFTGQELDPETGLYYYGGRYYDPEISRFVSPDPFVPSPDDPQSLDRYSYTINNPQRYIDPSGYDIGDSSYQYSFGVYGWVKFFMNLFSSHHHPTIIRKGFNHPMNQPRVENSGWLRSDNVGRYVDDCTGDDCPEGRPIYIEPYGIDKPAS